jgi:beta-fructofuranosidase
MHLSIGKWIMNRWWAWLAIGVLAIPLACNPEAPRQRESAAEARGGIDPRRLELAGDPHRPGYHFLAPANWMDDPNGVIQVGGETHLFYQWIPDSPSRSGGPFHWGHAVSQDLVHWRDLPIALSPTPGGPDQEGCWSGGAVLDRGVPTIVYRGRLGGETAVCVATSSDGLLTWDKYPGNPVIAEATRKEDIPAGDPYVWREGDHWYCVMGSHTGSGGAAVIYRSPDLLQWEYLGPLLTGRKQETGPSWEVVNFFKLGDRHVLTASLYQTWKSIYFAGTYRDHRFSSQGWADLDSGGHFYAPYVFSDDRGRKILMAWSWEGRHEDLSIAAGWSGVHVLPRVLSLREDGTLGYQPVPELQKLRGRHYRFQEQSIRPLDKSLLPEPKGDMLEILAVIDPGDSRTTGLRVRTSPEAEEETLIAFDRKQGRLSVDRRKASLDPGVHRHVYRAQPTAMVHSGPLQLEEDEFLRLHVFIDRSILEVFANGRLCLTSRIYPTRSDSTGIGLFAAGGPAMLRSMEVWPMSPIWPTAGTDRAE